MRRGVSRWSGMEGDLRWRTVQTEKYEVEKRLQGWKLEKK